jgi:hypothetical protein
VCHGTSKSAINLSINPHLSTLWAGKILGFIKAKQSTKTLQRQNLLSLFPHLFLKIFPIEHIPFTASWRYVTRERKDLLADYFVNMIFPLKKIM